MNEPNLFDIARDEELLKALGRRVDIADAEVHLGTDPLFVDLSAWANTIDFDVAQTLGHGAEAETRVDLSDSSAVADGAITLAGRGGLHRVSKPSAPRESVLGRAGRRSVRAGFAVAAAGTALSFCGVAAAVNGGHLPPLATFRLPAVGPQTGGASVLADVPSATATSQGKVPLHTEAGSTQRRSPASGLFRHPGVTGALPADSSTVLAPRMPVRAAASASTKRAPAPSSSGRATNPRAGQPSHLRRVATPTHVGSGAQGISSGGLSNSAPASVSRSNGRTGLTNGPKHSAVAHRPISRPAGAAGSKATASSSAPSGGGSAMPSTPRPDESRESGSKPSKAAHTARVKRHVKGKQHKSAAVPGSSASDAQQSANAVRSTDPEEVGD